MVATPPPPPMSPAPPLSPVPTEAPPPPQQPPAQPEAAKPNPLKSFDDMFNQIKELAPNTFDGFKLVMNKMMSQSFQAAHTFSLAGPPQGSSHKISETYVGGDMEKPHTVLLGETDWSGNTNGNAIFFPWGGSELRAQFQYQEKELQQLLFMGKQSFSSSVLNLNIPSLNLIHGWYHGQAGYVHRVTQNIDLGFLYDQGSNQMGQFSSLMVGGRYFTPRWSFNCMLGPSQRVLPFKVASISYYHKGNDNIQAGVEWEYVNMPQQTASVVSLAYKVDYPKHNISFKSSANSDWTVSSVLDKRIVEMGTMVSFSFMMNHAKNLVKLGISFSIGGMM